MQNLMFDVNLGAANTDLSLQAQLIDSSGENYGSAVTEGFVEIGGGSYLWNGTLPDNFSGGIIFQQTDTTFMSFTSINPGVEQVEIEDGLNMKQALSVIASVLGGLISGSGTNTITIKAINNPSVTRLVATVSNNGDRTSITLNLP